MSATNERSDRAAARRPGLSGTILRNGASNLLLPLAAVLTGPLLARTLGVDGRGELAAVLSPLYLGALALTLGLPEALVYFVGGGRLDPRSGLRLGVACSFAVGLAASALMWVLAPTLVGDDPELTTLLRVLTLATLPAALAGATARAVAQGLGRFDLINWERILSVGSRVALLVAFAVVGALTVTSAAWITAGTGLASTAVFLLAVRARRERPTTQAPVTAVLRFGGVTWIGSVAAVAILRLDQAMMVPLAGAVQLGYYTVAVAIAEITVFAVQAVRDVIYARTAAGGDTAMLATVSRLTVAALVVAAAIGACLASPAVRIGFGADFAPATSMVRVLLLATVPAGMAAVVSVALLASGRPSLLSGAYLAGLTVNVAAVLALVPDHGGLGAAWAAVISNTTLAALILLMARRVVGIGLLEAVVVRRGDLARVRGAEASAGAG